MQEDEQRARLLEESIGRLQKEIEVLEAAGPPAAAAGERPAAPSPAKDQTADVVLESQQAPVGTPKEKRVSNTPVRPVEGSTLMKAGGSSPDPLLSWAKPWSWGARRGGREVRRRHAFSRSCGPGGGGWPQAPSALAPCSRAGPASLRRWAPRMAVL
ncbi:unnamed protein product [Gulo gulo]|uniref:Uncharacterized protein n=1 Tax=Gulo gulo TaxID=48420 RepID=A0A9X9LQ93_GULGU|nr:unnamed protein product [Gulo gulo]